MTPSFPTRRPSDRAAKKEETKRGLEACDIGARDVGEECETEGAEPGTQRDALVKEAVYAPIILDSEVAGGEIGEQVEFGSGGRANQDAGKHSGPQSRVAHEDQAGCDGRGEHNGCYAGAPVAIEQPKIGRASCRKRVCQYV